MQASQERKTEVKRDSLEVKYTYSDPNALNLPSVPNQSPNEGLIESDEAQAASGMQSLYPQIEEAKPLPVYQPEAMTPPPSYEELFPFAPSAPLEELTEEELKTAIRNEFYTIMTTEIYRALSDQVITARSLDVDKNNIFEVLPALTIIEIIRLARLENGIFVMKNGITITEENCPEEFKSLIEPIRAITKAMKNASDNDFALLRNQFRSSEQKPKLDHTKRRQLDVINEVASKVATRPFFIATVDERIDAAKAMIETIIPAYADTEKPKFPMQTEQNPRNQHGLFQAEERRIREPAALLHESLVAMKNDLTKKFETNYFSTKGFLGMPAQGLLYGSTVKFYTKEHLRPQKCVVPNHVAKIYDICCRVNRFTPENVAELTLLQFELLKIFNEPDMLKPSTKRDGKTQEYYNQVLEQLASLFEQTVGISIDDMVKKAFQPVVIKNEKPEKPSHQNKSNHQHAEPKDLARENNKSNVSAKKVVALTTAPIWVPLALTTIVVTLPITVPLTVKFIRSLDGNECTIL